MFRNTCTLRRAVYRIYQNTRTFEGHRSVDFLLLELHPRFSSDQSQFHHKTVNTVLRGTRIDYQKRQAMQTAAEKSGIQSYLKFSNTAVRELPVEEDKGSDYRLVSNHWRIQGGARDTRPLPVQFLPFSYSLQQKLVLAKIQGLAPAFRLGNPGFATGSGEDSLLLVKTDVKLLVHLPVFRVLCIFVG